MLTRTTTISGSARRVQMDCYFDRSGHPITMEQWAKLLENREYCRIGDTTIHVKGHDVRISTVWLGLDHCFGEGPKLIFETMVFGGSQDGYVRRYSTWQVATEGHVETANMIERIRWEP
jgi:hypothetical protein